MEDCVGTGINYALRFPRIGEIESLHASSGSSPDAQ